MRFKKFGLIAVVVGVACSGAIGYWIWQRPDPRSRSEKRISADEARSRLAFQSIEGRLPKGKPIPRPKAFSPRAEGFWDAVDRSAEESHEHRAKLLKALHEKTETFFVDTEGYGRGRMKDFRPEDIMLGFWESFPPREQPGPPAFFPLSPGEPVDVVPADEDFLEKHENGIRDFVKASGFGFMKDRRQVAGFIPHGFGWSYREDSTKRLKIDHILLVGILMHENPVVYLSEELPSMKKARQAFTRPLDYFEDSGLRSLAGGNDLYIIQKDNTLRMLAKLSAATKQCLACHDADAGDLLGAFSYTLRERPKE